MAETSDSTTAEQLVPLRRRLKTILRVSYSIPFVMASLTGVAFALTKVDELLLGIAIAADVFVFSLFANLANDYYDHKSGADKDRFMNEDPEFRKEAFRIMGERFYWEGNAFDLGWITEKGGLLLLFGLAAAALAIAVPIILWVGWIVIPLGLIAFFLSYFYTAPPLNLGARGLGEADVLLSFSMMSFFAYYVMVQEFSVEMLLLSTTVGMGVMMMRLVDEMNGYKSHVRAGEKDLCVRLGLNRAVKLVIGVMVMLYAIIGSLTLFFDLTYAVMFLSLPLAYRAGKFLNDEADPFRFVRPVFYTFSLAFSNELLIILALTAQTALTYL